VSFEGFLRFDPRVDDYASTELRQFYFYFNRQSTYNRNETNNAPNYLYNGAKIITFRKLLELMGGNMAMLRTQSCRHDVSSKTVKG
jgi:hypothetical protein